MLDRTPGVTYEDLRRRFTWDLPDRFNIGVACSDAQSPAAPAVFVPRAGDTRRGYSFVTESSVILRAMGSV